MDDAKSRLTAIFSLIKECDVFADIGCDHGFISEFAVKKAQTVIAADISEKCLNKAKILLSGHKNVTFCLSDGLTGLTVTPDQIAVCGMGGHTVIGILKRYSGNARLILQPQNDAPAVRKFLNESGYKITDDLMAEEKNKFYTVIAAERGKQKLSGQQIEFGANYLAGDKTLVRYLQQRLKKVSAYIGAKNQTAALKIGDALQKIEKREIGGK